ncbi:hypothetical protein BDV35DRAFT_333790 [Aspergillus flavus]|uniref:Uncharacterized protein n=1 Tax=Aspergillus flavus TaxID=5059 RepID=A0A5N6HFX0_ASPFL|nr:hypothetical protein BDV35DRAFT_333790 [Aspergillus flavus]
MDVTLPVSCGPFMVDVIDFMFLAFIVVACVVVVTLLPRIIISSVIMFCACLFSNDRLSWVYRGL